MINKNYLVGLEQKLDQCHADGLAYLDTFDEETISMMNSLFEEMVKSGNRAKQATGIYALLGLTKAIVDRERAKETP